MTDAKELMEEAREEASEALRFLAEATKGREAKDSTVILLMAQILICAFLESSLRLCAARGDTRGNAKDIIDETCANLKQFGLRVIEQMTWADDGTFAQRLNNVKKKGKK